MPMDWNEVLEMLQLAVFMQPTKLLDRLFCACVMYSGMKYLQHHPWTCM